MTCEQPFLDETRSWVRWISKRVWNDREFDAALLLCWVGLWMICFPQTIGANAWGVVFAIAPSWVWGGSMIAAGLARGLSAGRRRKILAARAALFCVALWLAYGSAFWALSPKSFGGILFFWLSYQALKSYIRLRAAVKAEDDHAAALELTVTELAAASGSGQEDRYDG